ncbi:MAG: hypothetical protein Q9M92_01405 [Enterobacterales bacterium]|nr:hypothetical protein [Enterobacterales bacterium]
MENFICKLANMDVQYFIEESVYFSSYSFLPLNKEECSIIVTIEKNEPYFLTIEIGQKFRYEEYEGLKLPPVKYLNALLDSVFCGKVKEKRCIMLGLDVGYSIKIKLTGFDDINYKHKSIFLLNVISNEVIYQYSPWRE